ncbi:hypothetical protein [Paenibacillus oceani]|uniref:Uncharacterized protein n=1 Tax=Paenibacillus oceani TaxID=2772510 RepID=A0A927H1D5_9BACL|nr:hypothetical protein [Paenibacillus oceani]MBD2865051.1 hypothetical protein [Paenibacillus oceani]
MIVLSVSLSPVLADELLVEVLSPVVEVLGPALDVASVSDVLFDPALRVFVLLTEAVKVVPVELFIRFFKVFVRGFLLHRRFLLFFSAYRRSQVIFSFFSPTISFFCFFDGLPCLYARSDFSSLTSSFEI